VIIRIEGAATAEPMRQPTLIVDRDGEKPIVEATRLEKRRAMKEAWADWLGAERGRNVARLVNPACKGPPTGISELLAKRNWPKGGSSALLDRQTSRFLCRSALSCATSKIKVFTLRFLKRKILWRNDDFHRLIDLHRLRHRRFGVGNRELVSYEIPQRENALKFFEQL
jgi:hypothetical protein